ncbi:unnamed protein product [Anisakis simplex]|uniref:DUF4303 domain-containing protein n=1 Tax=Anisakis simplex TaxID=6269 RepID=A0A0M3K688_ANISI|nr:unnamed protein product [Anisakis simplex]
MRNDNYERLIEASFVMSFTSKPDDWIRKAKMNNFSMFLAVLDVASYDGLLSDILKTENSDHLTALKNEFRKYFPESSDNGFHPFRNSFETSVQIVFDDIRDEDLEL